MRGPSIADVIVGTDKSGVFLEIKILATGQRAREFGTRLMAELANRIVRRRHSEFVVDTAFALRAVALVNGYFDPDEVYTTAPGKQLLDTLSGRSGTPRPARADRRPRGGPRRREPRGHAAGVGAPSVHPPHSAYSTLHLTPDAPDDVVKAVHRAMAMLNHPDRGGSDEAMKKINEAYDQIQKERGKHG